MRPFFMSFFLNDYRDMAELKNIRIAISGIYDYAFEELPSLQLPLPGHGAPEWVEKKRVYKVYRPSTVLQAACSKFKLLPLTHHHPKTPVDGSNFRKLAVGYTGENPFVDYLEEKDEVGIRNTLLIYDDEALNAYDSGEVQLSPGYVAEFEWNKGQTPKGEEYDIVMKKITDVNHLALLPCGRGGSDAVVMDNAAKRLTIFDLVKKTSDGAPEGNDNASKEHKKQNEETAKKRVFGKEYKGFTGKNAIEKLMMEKQGFVQNAFSRKDIGNIDVVYGEVTNPKTHKGYGLSHIFDKHPEMSADKIETVINKGKLEKTYNGYNIKYDDFIVGINKGYKENGEYISTDNWIVTSFKNDREKVNDAIASAGTFTPDTNRPENPFSTEIIIIHSGEKRKSIFEIVSGTVFDRFK